MDEDLTLTTTTYYMGGLHSETIKTVFSTRDDTGIQVQVETEGEALTFSLSATQAQELGEYLLYHSR